MSDVAHTFSPRNLVPAIRASLNAKLERLLARPIIARVGAPSPEIDGANLLVFRALQKAVLSLPAGRGDTWHEDPDDGTFRVRISIDYDDKWRGYEKEIRETVERTVESAVTFLTEEQRVLLERSPREFLALLPRPETAELIDFVTENVGGSERVVELRLAAAPESRSHVRYIAIVPNLVQIERQLGALHHVEKATDDGSLGPLRALVGACDASRLDVAPMAGAEPASDDETLDQHQRECVAKAMSTPHFAVIEGPPGSGKTTVITAIIQRALTRGERVLVVSPTHVAVDNVIEKLVEPKPAHADLLEPKTLPVRYAARRSKLSARASAYWVGAKKQHRGATITERVRARLTESIPIAGALFHREDEQAAGPAPLSSAIAGVESVICGTPIGILSFDAVKNADVGAFELLIVDEVSKMTLSEFLAVAVKARRWVVVGDPAQLPPYNNGEENAATLDDVIPSQLELACSVGAILERVKPAQRREERVVVVSSDPPRAVATIKAQLHAVMPDCASAVGGADVTPLSSIVVCSREEAARACELTSLGSRRARILLERGVSLPKSGHVFVEPRERAQVRLFESAFKIYHAQPWSTRSGQRLRFLEDGRGVETYLPAEQSIGALLAHEVAARETERQLASQAAAQRRAVVDAVSLRFAVNIVSVYDWLTGMPTSFDISPLRELSGSSNPGLCSAVQPFVGRLKKQYRMHASLSSVPRELFYFREALLDGRPSDPSSGCRAVLVHVDGDGEEGESNQREADAIANILCELANDEAARECPTEILVITPYSKQEKLLRDMIKSSGARERLSNVNVEVCTFDRCQGREADYVLLSLVRSRASAFFDMPKRWNVALTRAKEGLFIVGNVEAYRKEAARARRGLNTHAHTPRTRGSERRPLMSLLARVVEAYDRQAMTTANTEAWRSR